MNKHIDRLELLKKKGFFPSVIYDIGAYEGNWTKEIKCVFPDARFFLFEANDAHKSELEATGWPYFLTLLGDRDKKITTYYSTDSSGDSIFLEQTGYYQKGSYVEKQLEMMTLAAVVEKNRIPLPDFIKIDVQGAEKLIIEGSSSLIKNAEALVIETRVLEYNKNAPLAHEIIALMNELEYIFIDIFEWHYFPSEELVEIDFFFVKKNSSLIKRSNFS
jgi:FkbM family methyltransferase